MSSKLDMSDCVIRDATQPLVFRITMADVTSAQCGDPSNCVIAKAIMAAFQGVANGVEVGHYITKVAFDGYVLRFKNPTVLTRGLKAFDASKDTNGKGCWIVVPLGEYTLLPPARTERLGPKQTPKKKYKPRVAARVAEYVKPRQVTRVPSTKTNRQAKQANKAA